MKWITVPQQIRPLDRRDFFRDSLAALGSLWMASKGLGQQKDKESDKQSVEPTDSPNFFETYGKSDESARQEKYTIRYIRDTAPPFQIPPNEGERYKDKVPDTLDIAERAKLGVQVMTAITAIDHLARTVYRPGASAARRTNRHSIPDLRTHSSETIGGVSYKVEIRGNSVLSIDPRGQNGPLYERAYFRGPVQWREVDRFVPQRTISW